MSQPQPNSNRTLWLLVLGLLATVLISLGLGRYALSLEQILTLLYQRITALPMPAIESQVLFDVRLPRILTTGLVGAGLALSGAVLQGVFRNPLVDPHVIGVSSGAAFGGTLAIFFSLSTLALFASTLTFGIATLVLVFLFNRRVASGSLLMLILTGMILSGFFAALVSLLQYISDTEEKLPSIVFWLMGSFATANGQKLLFFALPWALCSAVLLGLRWRLNVLSLNDRDVRALGVKVAPLRWCVLFCAGTIVACQVAISGSIGWVGLIIPHISRMLVGADHQKLLPTPMLVGAIYLIVIDDLARTLTASKIPISILTALLGAPVFALLVYRLRRQVRDE